MKKLLIFLTIFIYLHRSFHASQLSINLQKHAIPLIIDTDCGVDDMMAIAYLLNNPRVDIKAITTVGDGMSSWEVGTKNILNLLELAGHPQIPVSYGARKSSSPISNFPKELRQQSDHVIGIKLPHNSVQPTNERSWELMTNIIVKSPHKISLLCMGPLTNIALALHKTPGIIEKIKRIYIMGGAVLVPGNIIEKSQGFKNRVAEYNIFLDAKAAQNVFESGIPITLIPLDVTGLVPITNQFYTKIKSERKTALANFVYEVIRPFSGEGRQRAKEFFWDPVAAVIVTNPDVATYNNFRLMINLKKGPEYGRVIMNKKGSSIRVAMQINAQGFYEIFLKTLNRQPNLQSGHMKVE